MPALSIIVPVYKVEPYLKKCIDSILAQTFTDFELILVDDGSPDNCSAICDEYAEKDSRIVVIHKENGGQASARNRGLDIAKGDYIGFVDSDDWIHPQMYEIMIYALQSRDADIVRCGVFETYQDVEAFDVLDVESVLHNGKTISKQEYISNFYVGECYGLPFYLVDKLYKRKFFDNIRMPEGQRFEDAYVQLNIVEQSSNIVLLSEQLYFYLQRSGSTMHAKYDFWWAHDMWLLCLHDIEFFRSKGFAEEEKYALDEYFRRFCRDKLAIYLLYPQFKKKFKNIEKSYNREFKNIIFNNKVCKMRNVAAMFLYISPKISYKICKKYLPDCLYGFMR